MQTQPSDRQKGCNQPASIPKHVAIVMDGNGRWAQERDLPRFKGHSQGVENVRAVIEGALECGVEVLTLFAFSTENWQRPQEEVSFLFELFVKSIYQELPQLHKQGVKLRFIGSRAKFDTKLNDALTFAEEKTQDNKRLLIHVAADYGGRWDILQACQKLIDSGCKEVNAQLFEQHLSLFGASPPDLFIRTSGEMRLSNFLLWDLAYAELYFTPTLWPDFNKEAFKQAITSYQNRERRFGLISEQKGERHAQG